MEGGRLEAAPAPEAGMSVMPTQEVVRPPWAARAATIGLNSLLAPD